MVGNQPVSFTNKPTAATDNISKAQIQAQRELSQNNDPQSGRGEGLGFQNDAASKGNSDSSQSFQIVHQQADEKIEVDTAQNMSCARHLDEECMAKEQKKMPLEEPSAQSKKEALPNSNKMLRVQD